MPRPQAHRPRDARLQDGRPDDKRPIARRERAVPGLSLLLLPWLACGLLGAAGAQAQTPASAAGSIAAAAEPMSVSQLGQTLDRQLFEAYNRCELARFGALFAEDVEFFHDQGGLMRTRAAVVEATRRHICGKTRRELVEGSLQTYPMKDYGLVQVGEHRFCPLAPGAACSKPARFVNLWKGSADAPDAWQLTRVISYDH